MFELFLAKFDRILCFAWRAKFSSRRRKKEAKVTPKEAARMTPKEAAKMTPTMMMMTMTR